jgi:hypothetical protein
VPEEQNGYTGESDVATSDMQLKTRAQLQTRLLWKQRSFMNCGGMYAGMYGRATRRADPSMLVLLSLEFAYIA